MTAHLQARCGLRRDKVMVMNVNSATSPNASAAAKTTANQTDATASANVSPLAQALQKADARLQVKLTATSAELSSVGKLKSLASDIQLSGKTLGGLSATSSLDEMKSATTRFLSGFNALVTTAKTSTETISKGMARAIASDLSNIAALREIGVTRAPDGGFQLDAAKFEAAQKASPSTVQATLAKLGNIADKTATKELSTGGRVANSIASLSSRTTALKAEYDWLRSTADKLDAAQAATTNISYSNYGLAAYKANAF